MSLFFYFFICYWILSLSYFSWFCLNDVTWPVSVFIYSRYSFFYFRISFNFSYSYWFSFNSSSFRTSNDLFLVKSSPFSTDDLTNSFLCFLIKSFCILWCYSLKDFSLSNLYSFSADYPFFCMEPNNPNILFNPFWYPFSFSTSPAFSLRFDFKALNKNSCELFIFVISFSKKLTDYVE